MRQVVAMVNGLAHLLARVGLCLLIAFAFFTLLDGLSRGLLHRPIDAVRDVGDMVVAVAISSCFPLAFIERRNIVISMIDGVVSPSTSRAIDIFAALAVTGMTALFAYQFAVYAQQLGAAGETTAMLQLPKQPFWAVVDINLWLTLIVQMTVLARLLPVGGRARWVP